MTTPAGATGKTAHKTAHEEQSSSQSESKITVTSHAAPSAGSTSFHGPLVCYPRLPCRHVHITRTHCSQSHELPAATPACLASPASSSPAAAAPAHSPTFLQCLPVLPALRIRGPRLQVHVPVTRPGPAARRQRHVLPPPVCHHGGVLQPAAQLADLWGEGRGGQVSQPVREKVRKPIC